MVKTEKDCQRLVASVVDTTGWKAKGYKNPLWGDSTATDDAKQALKYQDQMTSIIHSDKRPTSHETNSKDSKLQCQANDEDITNGHDGGLHSPRPFYRLNGNSFHNGNIKDSGIEIKLSPFDRLSYVNAYRDGILPRNGKLLAASSVPENLMKIIDQHQQQSTKSMTMNKALHSSRLDLRTSASTYPSLKLNGLYNGTDPKKTEDTSGTLTQPCVSAHTHLFERSKSSDMAATVPAPLVSNGLYQKDYLEIIQAKDAVIHRHELFTERQRNSITELMRKNTTLQEKLHIEEMKSKSSGVQNEKLEMQIEELHYQNARLKAQLAESTAGQQDNNEKLERKLGESESLLLKMERLCMETSSSHAKEIESYKEKYKEYEKLLHLAKEETKKVKKDLKIAVQGTESLKKYIEDLPTQDEFKQSLQKIKELKREKEDLQETSMSLECRLKDLKEVNNTKEDEIQKEKDFNSELQAEIDRLNSSLEKYKEREKDGPVSIEELEELKWELERAKLDCDMLKKALQSKHKKLQEIHEVAKETQRKQTERIQQEEDTVHALEEAARKKDFMIEELKKTIKEVSNQNQDLMAQSFSLKESLAGLKQITSLETQQAQRRMFKELNVCLRELKSFVKLCSARAEGKEPNLAELLGVNDNIDDQEEDLAENTTIQDVFGVEIAKSKTQEIRKVRTEVDRLRSFVSDKYAEDVGNNVCKVQ